MAHPWITPEEVLDRVLEEPFDAGNFADYLEKKYTEIYRLTN